MSATATTAPPRISQLAGHWPLRHVLGAIGAPPATGNLLTNYLSTPTGPRNHFRGTGSRNTARRLTCVVPGQVPTAGYLLQAGGPDAR